MSRGWRPISEGLVRTIVAADAAPFRLRVDSLLDAPPTITASLAAFFRLVLPGVAEHR